MGEIPMSPEAQAMLPKAVHEVTGLFMGDQLANLLRGQSPQQRDQFWQETAGEFAPFSDKVTALRDVLKGAEITRNAYPQPVANVMSVHFSGTEDDMARTLLTDVLFARTTTQPGYMDYDMDVAQEAEAMVKELGVEDGLRGEQMKKVTLDKAVASVLTGGLKLNRQTQLDKSEGK